MNSERENQSNREGYMVERDARRRRIAIYAEKIQERVEHSSSEIIKQLVEDRHNQKMTQQDKADITGKTYRDPTMR